MLINQGLIRMVNAEFKKNIKLFIIIELQNPLTCVKIYPPEDVS